MKNTFDWMINRLSMAVLFNRLASYLFFSFIHKPTHIMLAPPAIFLSDHRHLTFDFEEYIKKELGLDLDNENKKEGQSHETCRFHIGV